MPSVPRPQKDKWAPSDTNPFGVEPLGDELDAIEAECGFWTATPQLQYICAIAHKRNVGRWALLGFVLGNLISWLPPYVVLSDRDGSTTSVEVAGSLNSFFHAIEESGEGKTRLMNVANEIVPPNVNRYGNPSQCPEPDPDLLTSGTGEGLLKHFVSMGRHPDAPESEKNAPKVMVQHTDVAVIQIDEVGTYTAELARSTSKMAGVQTSLWSGQRAGSNTAGEESRTRTAKHSARVIVQMLGQPSLFAPLFTEELIEGGTPQRPCWLPGSDWTPCPVTQVPNDPNFRRPSPVYPAQIHQMMGFVPTRASSYPGSAQSSGTPAQQTATPQIGGMTYTGMGVPYEMDFPRPTESPTDLYWIKHSPKMAADIKAEDELRRSTKLSPAQKARLSPEERAARKGARIRTHTTFTRIKIAVGFALLHHRPGMHPTDQDWELAGVMMRVNLGMLAYLHEEAEAVRKQQATAKGKDKAEEHAAFLAAMDDFEADDVSNILKTVLGNLFSKPMRASELSRKLSNRRQKMLRAALERGEERGVLFMEEHTGFYFPLINGTVFDARYSNGVYRPTPVTANRKAS